MAEREWVRKATAILEANGLVPDLAYKTAVSILYAWYYTDKMVRITSTYRAPLYQRALQERWDAGDRSGLIARPATYSWHMQGRAIDVSTKPAPTFNAFRYAMEYQNVEWGGNFRNPDPVHFQWTIGGKPLSINQLISS